MRTLTTILLGLLASVVLFAAEGDAKPRTSRLQGTADLDRNNEVTGAVVLVQNEDDEAKVYLTATDSKGTFRLDGLHDGSYRILFWRAGYTPVLKEKVQVKFPFRAVVEVTMEPTEDDTLVADATPDSEPPEGDPIRIRGRTVSNGGVVDDVRLRLIQPAGRFDPRTAISDIDGVFLIDDLPQDEWRLEVESVGYLPMQVEVDVHDDTDLEVVLVAQPADYKASPLELMPREEVIPPPGFESNRFIDEIRKDH